MSKANNHQHLPLNSPVRPESPQKPPAARRGSPAFTLFSLVQQLVIRISSLIRPSRHGLAVTDHSGSRRDVSQTRRFVIRH